MTELRQGDNLFRLIFNALPLPLIRAIREVEVLDLNSMAQDIFNATHLWGSTSPTVSARIVRGSSIPTLALPEKTKVNPRRALAMMAPAHLNRR